VSWETTRIGTGARRAAVSNPTGSMPHLYQGTLSDAEGVAVAAYVMALGH
jgi:mono/diheme cytochrome c family protein